MTLSIVDCFDCSIVDYRLSIASIVDGTVPRTLSIVLICEGRGSMLNNLIGERPLISKNVAFWFRSGELEDLGSAARSSQYSLAAIGA